MAWQKLKYEHLRNWDRLAPELRHEIESGLYEGETDAGLKFLCGAASALAMKDYELFETLIGLSLKMNLSPDGIYEGILQCYLFLGFPRAIEGMRHLSEIFLKNGIKLISPRPDHLRDYEDDGHRLCQIIYGQKYSRLLEVMNKISPELAAWMILEGYGKVLSRPGLTAKERELVTVAALVSEGVPHQLSSHIRGALNAGAAYEELTEIIDLLALWIPDDAVKRALSFCESCTKSSD